MSQICIVVTLFVGGLMVGEAQGSSRTTGSIAMSGQPRLETFVRTPEGEWETMVRGDDGTERVYRFTPPNQVDPQVRVGVSLERGSTRVRVRYRYYVTNGMRARQELAALFIRGLLPATVLATPSGWQVNSPAVPGTLTLVAPFEDNIHRGVPRGATTEWSLESAALPGVLNIQSLGATAGGFAVEVPPGLSEKQRRELEALSRDPFVDTPAIGPVIASGVGEPELTFSMVLVRVLSHYRSQLQLWRHPAAAEVAQIAGMIDNGPATTLETPGVRSALDRLSELSRQNVSDNWHRELSKGLAVSVEALLSGALPDKGMPE